MIDLHFEVKRKGKILTSVSKNYLEMCRIAHFMCKKDLSTKIAIEKLARQYLRKVRSQDGTDNKNDQNFQAIDKYTGKKVNPITNLRESDSDDYESCSSDESDEEQKFIEIRDVDVYSEVMDAQGELKVATIEIKRLREQLTLIGAGGSLSSAET